MIKDIQYKGYAASPSDYECSDGELAMSLNIIQEDGALRPILQPDEIMELNNAMVKCVHETSVSINYVVVTDNNDLGWRTVNGGYARIESFGDKDIYQITPIGNTLVVSTSDGIYYFLWKDDSYISLGNEFPELNVSPYISTNLMNTNSFKYIFEQTLDNPQLSEEINSIGDNWDEILYPELCDNLCNGAIDAIGLNHKQQQNIYEKVFSAINPRSMILKEKGYFFEPFYVRFAYRLYDGSHVRHTVPVLMVPMTLGKPLFSVIINKGTGSNNESTTKALFEPIYFAGKLHAEIDVSDTISNWKDIITDIDIFVTEPLMDYSDSAQSLVSIRKLSYDDGEIPMKVMAEHKWGKVSELAEGTDEYNMSFYVYAWFRKNNDGTGQTKTRFYFTNYTEISSDCYFAFDCSRYTVYSDVLTESQPEGFTVPDGRYSVYKMSDYLALTETDQAYAFKTKEQISETDVAKINMYIISKGTIGSISGGYYIETKRVDGQSYKNILTSCNSFYKISELNLSELNNNKWDGMINIIEGTLPSLTTRQTLSDLGQRHNKPISKQTFSYNGRLNVILEKEQIKNACTSFKKQNPAVNTSTSDKTFGRAYVEINENGQKAYVEIPLESQSFRADDLLMFSFPHNNAKKLYVRSSSIWYEIPLKQHEFLNLSYAFNMFAPLNFASSEQITESDFVIPSADTIEYGNIIRLSDVNNPFRFSEEYTVSLPVKEVYALSTAAKALSQGQFGQYPLYAFTSDGIWALELTSTGTYSARQPISRDVVINKESITQIDNSVLFATERGIMLVSGSQVICISDKINTMDLFTLAELPKADKLVNIYNGIGASVASIDDVVLLPFNEFLAECKMLYDYPHQHIIVYNPKARYAYVYSLKSQQWGMMTSNIKDNVNSYPEALAMTIDNKLVDFSKSANGKASAIIVTRPVKMEMPDVYKTISTIIQRGNLNNMAIAQVLYGSNDMKNWFVVWSSNDAKMNGFRGTPYKCYRLAIIRGLCKEESLRGFSIQYETRLTNRLR